MGACDRTRADERDPHGPGLHRNWYCTPPLVAASVQIIVASPEGNGGQLTVTPRATSAARTSARSSTSIAMCSITAAAPSGQPAGAGLRVVHLDQLDAGVAARVVPGQALVVSVRAAEFEPERLEQRRRLREPRDDDADVIDAAQLHPAPS